MTSRITRRSNAFFAGLRLRERESRPCLLAFRVFWLFERDREPMKKRPLVVVTRRLPDVVETRMRELFDARLNHEDKPLSPAELVEAAKTADVLGPTVTDEIDASVLAQAGPNLKLVANFGNG